MVPYFEYRVMMKGEKGWVPARLPMSMCPPKPFRSEPLARLFAAHVAEDWRALDGLPRPADASVVTRIERRRVTDWEVYAE